MVIIENDVVSKFRFYSKETWVKLMCGIYCTIPML